MSDDGGLSAKSNENQSKQDRGGATRGLHASNMVVKLTDVSDGACKEEVSFLKVLEESRNSRAMMQSVWYMRNENH